MLFRSEGERAVDRRPAVALVLCQRRQGACHVECGKTVGNGVERFGHRQCLTLQRGEDLKLDRQRAVGGRTVKGFGHATGTELVGAAAEQPFGGIERAAETIRPLLPLLRARELKRVLDEPAVAQRLGFVIEACGNKSLAKVVRDWLPDELTPVTLSPAKGKRDRDQQRITQPYSL